MENEGAFSELWAYLKIRWKWWLLPLAVLLILLLVLLIFGNKISLGIRY